MNFDPYKLAQQLLEHGSEWADKNAAADVLEETRKTLRSQIALKFLPDAGSVAKAEMMAEATQEYIDHVRSMVEARRASNIARCQYDTDKTYIEMVRSQESTERAMINLR
jgi:hypothetical protein